MHGQQNIKFIYLTFSFTYTFHSRARLDHF